MCLVIVLIALLVFGIELMTGKMSRPLQQLEQVIDYPKRRF